MPRFKRKPTEIEAVRWTGNNRNEVTAFMREAYRAKRIPYGKRGFKFQDRRVGVKTDSGWVWAPEGFWIIRGVVNELYPCAPDVFEKTYEPVED